jgi:hypothetical protein
MTSHSVPEGCSSGLSVRRSLFESCLGPKARTILGHSVSGSEGGISVREEVLHLRIGTDQRDRWGSQILLAFQSSATRMNCWRIPLSLWSGFAPILDSSSGRRLHDATVRWGRSELAVALPMFALPNFDAMFIKLSGWRLFFDRSGWNRVQITSGPEAILTKQVKLAGLMTFS